MNTGCDGRKAGELTADDISRVFVRGVDQISVALSSGDEDQVKEALAEQGGVVAGLMADVLIKFTRLCNDVRVIRADVERRADMERASKTGQVHVTDR